MTSDSVLFEHIDVGATRPGLLPDAAFSMRHQKKGMRGVLK